MWFQISTDKATHKQKNMQLDLKILKSRKQLEQER